jgi:hypothetical protein
VLHSSKEWRRVLLKFGARIAQPGIRDADAWAYGSSLTPLQMTGDFTIVKLGLAQSGVVLTSSTDDVVCAGDVAAPYSPIPPETPVFADGFEQPLSEGART